MTSSLHRRSPYQRWSLTALLLLCLSAGVWLQGEHIHLDEHPVHECLVCHHGAAAACGQPASAPALIRAAPAIATEPAHGFVQLAVLLPPSRAPPVTLG